MKPCRRILCVIDPDASGEQALHQAVAHAGRCGARLITARVVDHHSGFESHHVPFLAPLRLATELAGAASRRIRAMLDRICPEGNLCVEVGAPRSTVIGLATACEADLVLVGAGSAYGFQTTQARVPPHNFPFDVVTVRVRCNWNPLELWRRGTAATAPASLDGDL